MSLVPAIAALVSWLLRDGTRLRAVLVLKTAGGFGVQQESTAASPDSRQLARPPAHRPSWDDGQTPAAPLVRDQEADRVMTEYPDESYDELVRLANLRPPGPG